MTFQRRTPTLVPSRSSIIFSFPILPFTTLPQEKRVKTTISHEPKTKNQPLKCFSARRQSRDMKQMLQLIRYFVLNKYILNADPLTKSNKEWINLQAVCEARVIGSSYPGNCFLAVEWKQPIYWMWCQLLGREAHH